MNNPTNDSIFKIPVSFTENVRSSRDTDLSPLSLSDILEGIKAGRWRDAIARVREVKASGDKDAYRDAKTQLPAFFASGTLYTRAAGIPIELKLEDHSGFLQADIDSGDNPGIDLSVKKDLMRADEHVAAFFTSPSGEGLKALVRIEAKREKHAVSFAAAERHFLKKYGLVIDKATKDVGRPCFVSDDPDLWMNSAAIILPPLEAESAVEAAAKRKDSWYPPTEMTAADITEMLSYIKFDKKEGPPYDDWIRISSAVWSVLPMAEGTQVLMAWAPEQKLGEYAHKWKNKLHQVGIGTLVHYAQRGGFDAKAAARRKRWAGRIRFADSPTGAETVDAGGDPAADVKYVELTREFLFECLDCAQFGDARLWNARVQGAKLYDHLAQSWRTYRRGIWERDDTQQTIIECSDSITDAYGQLAKTITDEIIATPAPDDKKDPRQRVLDRISKRQFQLRNKTYITAVLSFAESLLPTKATQFDRQPNLLCVNNGVLDFDAGVFREHRPADMLTVRTNVTFDPDAKCPNWDKFLDYITGGDRELVAYLARMVGYSLTGHVDKDVLPFLYGKGANGKSTFILVLKMLGGDFMTTISIDALLAKASDSTFDYKKAMLEGKRIVVTDEIPENRRFNESSIKSLVGGDEIVARRPYEKPYTFSPTHKLWLIGNHKPDIRGVDLGIWRRIHLVPWVVTIPEGERRPRHEMLAEFRAELSGILNWAIRGHIDMADNGGLRPPAKVQEAVKEYQQDSDQLAQFLEERTERVVGSTAKATAILHAYMAWCQDNGEDARYKSSRKLIKYLREHGYRAEKYGDGGWIVVFDLKLSSSSSERDEDNEEIGELFQK